MDNLFEKILLLVKDLEPLGPMAKARAIEHFFKSQSNLIEQVKNLDISDLSPIRSRAAQILTEASTRDASLGVSYAEDPETYRLLCLFRAIVEYLRSKSLLPHDLNFKKSDPLLRSCQHKNASLSMDSLRFVCPECQKTLKPLLWEVAE